MSKNNIIIKRLDTNRNMIHSYSDVLDLHTIHTSFWDGLDSSHLIALKAFFDDDGNENEEFSAGDNTEGDVKFIARVRR